MYKIKLTARAKRELKNISRLHEEVISSVFEDLKDDPLLGKPLTRELTGSFSIKIGVYRIIYKINKKDEIITAITAGHRATIYQYKGQIG